MITDGNEARNGGVGDDHVLPGGPGLVELAEVAERVGGSVGTMHATLALRVGVIAFDGRKSAFVGVIATTSLKIQIKTFWLSLRDGIQGLVLFNFIAYNFTQP